MTSSAGRSTLGPNPCVGVAMSVASTSAHGNSDAMMDERVVVMQLYVAGVSAVWGGVVCESWRKCGCGGRVGTKAALCVSPPQIKIGW